jgi:endonuclease/exonuclease/phosphatase family metal-dependent hydrolase
MTRVRLVTINTWKGDGPYRQRIAELARQLVALEVDLVACQEALAFIGARGSTVETLARALGFEASFVPARDKQRVVEGELRRTWSGLAVLSRWPIAETRTVVLPADAADGPRLAQLATIEAPAGPLHVLNTHLTHLRGRDDLRCAQLATLLEEARALPSARARLLCGDLNSRPSSPPIAYLAGRDHGWDARDAWELGGAGEHGATLSDRNPYVRDGIGEHTIDYVWSLARRGEAHPAIDDARVVLDRPGVDGVVPSDHFGVLVALSL